MDGSGHITLALALGNYPAASVDEAVASSRIEPKIGPSISPGTNASDRTWTSVSTGAGGAFDLKSLQEGNTGSPNSTYFSFWLFSPKALDNLLLDPHLPTLDLVSSQAAALQVWLNAKSIPTRAQGENIIAPTLLLQQGWNHLLVKVVRTSGSAMTSLKLNSSQSDYLTQLRGAQQLISEENAATTVAASQTAPAPGKVQSIVAAEKEKGILVSSERDEKADGGRHFSTQGQWNSPGLWAAPEANNRAIWEAQLPQAGLYRVEIWYGEDPNRDHADNALLRIEHAGGEKQTRLNLRTHTSQWVDLGTYRFEPNRGAKVTLEGADAGGNLIADMVRFVPVG